MAKKIKTPENIWIITEETSSIIQNDNQGKGNGNGNGNGNGSCDNREKIDQEATKEIVIRKGKEETVIKKGKEETVVTKRKAVGVSRLKQEMKGFLQEMREIFDEVEEPNSTMVLDEVEFSVGINDEGKISLLGIGGGKPEGKGVITFKFKRK